MERWKGVIPNHAPTLYSLCKNGKGVGSKVFFHTDIRRDIKLEKKKFVSFVQSGCIKWFHYREKQIKTTTQSILLVMHTSEKYLFAQN